MSTIQSAINFLSSIRDKLDKDDMASADRLIAELMETAQQEVPTVYLYRQHDGNTQVMAPDINDPTLVIDMLEEGIRAMTEGRPITRN